MWKGILYSIITLIVYHLAIEGLGLLFSFVFTRDYFLNIEEFYFLFIDTIFYLVLIGISVFFIKKWGKTRIIDKDKFTIKNIFLVFVLFILFRLVEDPLLRRKIILGTEKFPMMEKQIITTSIERISLILNIIILGPIFEELLFRRILINFFLKKYLILGIIFSSLIFASIHFNSSYTNYHSVLSSFLFGFVACLIYIRKGLLYSILFHMGYNTIWLILKGNKTKYWSILKELNFGVIYWGIIITSVGIILYFSVISINQIISYSMESKDK